MVGKIHLSTPTKNISLLHMVRPPPTYWKERLLIQTNLIVFNSIHSQEFSHPRFPICVPWPWLSSIYLYLTRDIEFQYNPCLDYTESGNHFSPSLQNSALTSGIRENKCTQIRCQWKIMHLDQGCVKTCVIRSGFLRTNVLRSGICNN